MGGLETKPHSLPRPSLTRRHGGFNEAKSRHGLEQICHHQANRLLICGLLTILVLIIERLYRLRYLHRGTHRCPSAAELLLLLWVNLFRSSPADTS